MDEIRIFDGIQTVNYSVNNPNFNVVISTTKPSKPAENTIWVNDTATNWVYSSTQPDDESLGWVWIQSGLKSEAVFQILPSNKNNNEIYSYPIRAYSCRSTGTWTKCEMQFYVGGKWINPDWGVIINNGQTVIKAANWFFKGYYYAPSLDDYGLFTFQSTVDTFYITGYAICKTLNLANLNATKVTITWAELEYFLYDSSWDTNQEPRIYLALFQSNSAVSSYYKLQYLKTQGGSEPIDLEKYKQTIKTYPYIGLVIERFESTAGAYVPIIDFQVS
jgi:hypothetical protein